jgi:hypothetical protein
MEPHGFKQLLTEADTYLAFFKRRVEIEDAYADQLTRLAVQDVEIQSQLYTVKSAWSALRREVSREAESRRRYANLLRTLVHDPLSSFRDSKCVIGLAPVPGLTRAQGEGQETDQGRAKGFSQ